MSLMDVFFNTFISKLSAVREKYLIINYLKNLYHYVSLNIELILLFLILLTNNSSLLILCYIFQLFSVYLGNLTLLKEDFKTLI